MAKYDRLKEYLMNSGKEAIEISFAEIENILQFPLPSSAYVHNAWWSNNGHSHARTWTDAGYKVASVRLKDKTIKFTKNLRTTKIEEHKVIKSNYSQKQYKYTVVKGGKEADINLLGHKFEFVQRIVPYCNEQGAIKFYPQDDYENKNTVPLSENGKGAFCRFEIDAEDVPGVYLWIVDDEIIYIGETKNLRKRFNTGYGNISPRNCYLGGQSTNCKMNKVVLEYFEAGKQIKLYFLKANDYKKVELELLSKICTRYNVKDN